MARVRDDLGVPASRLAVRFWPEADIPQRMGIRLEFAEVSHCADGHGIRGYAKRHKGSAVQSQAKIWTIAAAAALAIAASALAQSDALEGAMGRMPAPAPGPAFPDIPEVDMTQLCPTIPANNRFYPERARERDQTGRVVLDCSFGTDGKPQACQVLFEDPPRFDFGTAATRIACFYRLGNAPSSAPASQTSSHLPSGSHLYRRQGDGEPIRVRAAIHFNLAG
jgi:hypothetical protein